MNRQQWLSVWGFDRTHPSLETARHLFCALPNAAVKLVSKVPLAIFPLPLILSARKQSS
jgi:hypothetical protein